MVATGAMTRGAWPPNLPLRVRARRRVGSHAHDRATCGFPPLGSGPTSFQRDPMARFLPPGRQQGGELLMDRTRMRIAIVMATGLAVAGLTGGSAAMAAEDVATKVQAAKTAADHEALAGLYDKQAAAAKSEAATHRKMGEAYKGAGTSATGKSAGLSAMPQHCDS